MSTGNYDILVQLHEKLLNKSLAMVFYNGMLKVEDTYKLEKDIPASFKPYSTFDYKITLANEPFVDFRNENELFIRISAQLRLEVLAGIVLTFSLDFYVKSNIVFDMANNKMYFKLLDAQIVNIGVQHTYYVGKEFLSKLNYIIDEIIKKYFKNQVKEIEIPVAIDGLTLPLMPEGDAYKLPLKKADIKILDKKVLVAGVSLFNTNGSMTGMQNLAQNKDCYIAIKESAVQETLKFWWDNTTFDKKQDFDESAEIGFATPLASGLDKVTRVATLGFVQTERDYENMVLNYGGEVKIEKQPEIDLKTGNKIEIKNLEFVADLFAELEADVHKDVDIDTSSFVPDHITPWKDDIDIREVDKHKTLVKLENTFTLKINNAEGQLKINDENNLAVKITDADFKIEFNKKGTTFSDNTWEKLMDFIKQKVLDRIPEIVISPSLILAKKNIFGFTLGLSNTDLNISDNNIVLSTDIVVNELKSNTIAVPSYIGDEETKGLHSITCKEIADIDADERIGFYVMYEALAAGYKPCNICLKSYNLK